MLFPIFLDSIVKCMNVVFNDLYDRKMYTTLCGVMLCHVLLIWAMSFLQTDQFVETHSPENAIKIRFVRMNKTETIQESDTTTATHSTQSQIQSTTQQQPMSKTTASHQKPTKVIQSSESKKIIMDQPQQDTQKSTLTKTTDDSSKKRTETTQQQSMQTQTKTELNTSKQQTSSGQSNQQTQKSGGEEGRENKKQQSAESAPKQQPLMVSKVDILSFGQLNYDDRELQNQQRLLILTIKINPQGQPIDVRVKQSTGLSNLDARGVQAAQKTKFKPHILNGEAVAIVVDFPIQLKLGRNR